MRLFADTSSAGILDAKVTVINVATGIVTTRDTAFDGCATFSPIVGATTSWR